MRATSGGVCSTSMVLLLLLVVANFLGLSSATAAATRSRTAAAAPASTSIQKQDAEVVISLDTILHRDQEKEESVVLLQQQQQQQQQQKTQSRRNLHISDPPPRGCPCGRELVCSDGHCSYYCIASCSTGKGGGGVVGKGGYGYGYGYGYGGYGYGRGKGGGAGYYHGIDDGDGDDDDDSNGGYDDDDDDDSNGGYDDDDDGGAGYYPPYDGGEPPGGDDEGTADDDGDGGEGDGGDGDGEDGAFTNEDEPYTWEGPYHDVTDPSNYPENSEEGGGLIRENAEGCSAIAANGGVAPGSLPREAFDLGMKVTIEGNDPWATIAAIESYLQTSVAPSLSTCLATSRQAPDDAVAAAAGGKGGSSSSAAEQRQQQQAASGASTESAAAASHATASSSTSSATKTHNATVSAGSTTGSTTSSSTSSSSSSTSSTSPSAVDEAAASILKVDFTVGRSNTPFCNASEPVAPGESCESLIIETTVVHEASFDSAANPGAMEQAVMNAISCADIAELPGVVKTHEPCPFVIPGGGSGVTEDGTVIGTGPDGRDAENIDKEPAAPLPDAIQDESAINNDDDDGMVAGVIIAILVACITILVLLLLFVRRSMQYRAKRRLANGQGDLDGLVNGGAGYYYDENGSLRNIHVVGDGDNSDFGSRLTGYTSVVQRNASQQELNKMGLPSTHYNGRRPGDGDGDAEALENAYMNQDVHICTSATCRVCVGQQGSTRSVTFLRSTLPGDESTLTTNPPSEKSSRASGSSRASQQRRLASTNVHDSVSL
jgi:hypothetical protein